MPSWDEARKRWRGKVTLNGQSLRSDFKTKREALDWEKETRDHLQKTMETPTTPIGTDFRTFFNKYLDEVELLYDPKTYDNKQRVIKRLSNFLKKELKLEVIPLTEVTTDLVKDYLVSQLKGIPEESQKPRTAAGYNEDLKHLKAAWAWGVEKGEVLQNPVQSIKKVSYKKSCKLHPSYRGHGQGVAGGGYCRESLLECLSEYGG